MNIHKIPNCVWLFLWWNSCITFQATTDPDVQQSTDRTYEVAVRTNTGLTDYENIPAHPDTVYTALHFDN